MTKNNIWQYEHCTSKCTYNVLFCPKFRRPVLNTGIQRRLKQLLKEQQHTWHYQLQHVNISADCVHLILQCDPTIGIDNLVAKIKGLSARTLKKEFPKLNTRLPNLWTRKRLIISIGPENVDALVQQFFIEQKNV